jgi:hypothetical protein
VKRAATLALAIAVPVVPFFVAAAPASARTLAPFVIREFADFSNPTPVETFQTTVGPFCRSGTFQDTVDSVVGNEVTITSRYTCADGSGTFTFRKVEDYTVSGMSATYRGPAKFLGGTGAYAFHSGQGVDFGQQNAAGIGSGVIVGVVLRS